MKAGKGSAFLLKTSNGAEPPSYTTVAGLRTTRMSINASPIPLDGSEDFKGALVSVSVAGNGVFTGHAAEARIKASALSGGLDDYELSFESGERMRGSFLITRIDYSGDFNGERTYTISLESAGQVQAL